jgi:magnesium chelatase family protein
MLVASMNPCPCGYRGSRTTDCRCDDATVARYIGKLSGPLLDRIDLHVGVQRVSFDELVGQPDAETSATIRARVQAARTRQHERYRDMGFTTNAELPSSHLRAVCPLDAGSRTLLEAAMNRGTITARAFDRVTRVGRTIADLAGSETIAREHVAEALLYRSLEGATRR